MIGIGLSGASTPSFRLAAMRLWVDGTDEHLPTGAIGGAIRRIRGGVQGTVSVTSRHIRSTKCHILRYNEVAPRGLNFRKKEKSL